VACCRAGRDDRIDLSRGCWVGKRSGAGLRITIDLAPHSGSAWPDLISKPGDLTGRLSMKCLSRMTEVAEYGSQRPMGAT
jgi:hypothetical protein